MSITTRQSSTETSSSSGDSDLTRSKLYRFGGVIAALILATMAIALWSLRSASGDVKSTSGIGKASTALNRTVEETLTVNRRRLLRTIALYSNSPALATRMVTEGEAALAAFDTNTTEFVRLATEAGVSPDAIAALHEKSDAWAALAKTVWAEDPLVLTAENYDTFLATFLDLRATQTELETVLSDRAAVIAKSSDSDGTRGQLLATLGSLGALAGLILVGRKIVQSVVATHELKVKVAAAQERERALSADGEMEALSVRNKVDSLLAAVGAAAAGDLTVKVDVSGSDAVGRVGDALTQLFANLRTSVSMIAANSETLAAAAEELQVVAGQMGANSSETSKQVSLVTASSISVSRNVETVSAGAEEMAASIKEIARNTSEAAKVAAQAVEAARVTNDTVGRLGDSSAEIDQIVKVITGIAQQTNLLALNATIEAARAGEAGKGFAVVANEVKELAKETAKATEDISARIEAIQIETRLSVESITGIVTIIDQIAEFQDTIASAVEQQAATTSEIARSVTDAAGGSAEITANMRTVSGAADSTASGASDSQVAASELARMAAELKTLVGQFTY